MGIHYRSVPQKRRGVLSRSPSLTPQTNHGHNGQGDTSVKNWVISSIFPWKMTVKTKRSSGFWACSSGFSLKVLTIKSETCGSKCGRPYSGLRDWQLQSTEFQTPQYLSREGDQDFEALNLGRLPIQTRPSPMLETSKMVIHEIALKYCKLFRTPPWARSFKRNTSW